MTTSTNKNYYEVPNISIEKALEIKSDDKPSKTYMSLCDYYKKNPPSEGFEGTYIQKSKL